MERYVAQHKGEKEEPFSESETKKATDIATEMTRCSKTAFGVSD